MVRVGGLELKVQKIAGITKEKGDLFEGNKHHPYEVIHDKDSIDAFFESVCTSDDERIKIIATGQSSPNLEAKKIEQLFGEMLSCLGPEIWTIGHPILSFLDNGKQPFLSGVQCYRLNGKVDCMERKLQSFEEIIIELKTQVVALLQNAAEKDPSQAITTLEVSSSTEHPLLQSAAATVQNLEEGERKRNFSDRCSAGSSSHEPTSESQYFPAREIEGYQSSEWDQMESSNTIRFVGSAVASIASGSAEFPPDRELSFLQLSVEQASDLLRSVLIDHNQSATAASLFDSAVAAVLQSVGPCRMQLDYRASVAALFKQQVRTVLKASAFSCGMHELRAFLPDDPTCITVVIPPGRTAQWHEQLAKHMNQLIRRPALTEATKLNASVEGAAVRSVNAALAEMEASCIPSSIGIGAGTGAVDSVVVDPSVADVIIDSPVYDHEITKVSVGNEDNSFIVDCAADSNSVTISCNRRQDIILLAFLEEVDGLVGKAHLFKHSLLLVRAWWSYETAAYFGTPIKHYLSDLALCVMLCAVFNQYHARISSPLQALCLFLAEYAVYNGSTHAITLQGIVPFTSDNDGTLNSSTDGNNSNSSGNNSSSSTDGSNINSAAMGQKRPSHHQDLDSGRPHLRSCQADHMISPCVMEKYWHLFNLNTPMPAAPYTVLPLHIAFSKHDISTELMSGAFFSRGHTAESLQAYKSRVQQQQYGEVQQHAPLALDGRDGETVETDPTHGAGRAPAQGGGKGEGGGSGGASKGDGDLQREAKAKTSLSLFKRAGFDVVHPFLLHNMVAPLTEKRAARVRRAFQIGAVRLQSFLSSALAGERSSASQDSGGVKVGDEDTIDPSRRGPGSAPQSAPKTSAADSFFPSFYPITFERFGKRIMRPDIAKSLKLGPEELETIPQVINQFPSKRIARDILYCNFVLEATLSEWALLAVSTEILEQKRVQPVGEVGKVLSETSSSPYLTYKLKDAFGGLKKFLEMRPELFVLSTSHRFNPEVTLRRTLDAFGFNPTSDGVDKLIEKIKPGKSSARRATSTSASTSASSTPISTSRSIGSPVFTMSPSPVLECRSVPTSVPSTPRSRLEMRNRYSPQPSPVATASAVAAGGITQHEKYYIQQQQQLHHEYKQLQQGKPLQGHLQQQQQQQQQQHKHQPYPYHGQDEEVQVQYAPHRHKQQLSSQRSSDTRSRHCYTHAQGQAHGQGYAQGLEQAHGSGYVQSQVQTQVQGQAHGPGYAQRQTAQGWGRGHPHGSSTRANEAVTSLTGAYGAPSGMSSQLSDEGKSARQALLKSPYYRSDPDGQGRAQGWQSRPVEQMPHYEGRHQWNNLQQEHSGVQNQGLQQDPMSHGQDNWQYGHNPNQHQPSHDSLPLNESYLDPAGAEGHAMASMGMGAHSPQQHHQRQQPSVPALASAAHPAERVVLHRATAEVEVDGSMLPHQRSYSADADSGDGKLLGGNGGGIW